MVKSTKKLNVQKCYEPGKRKFRKKVHRFVYSKFVKTCDGLFIDEEMYDKKDPYGNKDLLPAAKSMRMLDNVWHQLGWDFAF